MIQNVILGHNLSIPTSPTHFMPIIFHEIKFLLSLYYSTSHFSFHIALLMHWVHWLLAVWELHVLFLCIYKQWFHEIVFPHMKLLCRLWEPELLDPHEPVQRGPVPGKSLLWSFQAARLPFCLRRSTTAQLTVLQPCLAASTSTGNNTVALRQWVQRRDGRSSLQRSPTYS